MRNRNVFRLLGLTLLLLTLVSAPISSAAPPPSGPGAEPFVEGEILLQVKPGFSPSEMARAVGGTVLRSIGDGSIHLLKVAEGAVPAVVKALNDRPGVAFAEPNWLRQLHDAPNDTGYGWKWDLNNTGDAALCDGNDCPVADADMDWQEAYDYLGGSVSGSAIVAVIDTGIDLNHPDLIGKIVPGWDYLGLDSDPTDTYGHGTHVAGIALAGTNNGIGTAGVGFSPDIKVMPLRVCDSRGCPTDAIVAAIYHAADNGAKVINMSLGGGTPSSAEEAAINYAWDNGLVIAASSGNGSASSVSYPAAFENCIAVGSTSWDDTLADYSNTGSALDVVAPGGEMSALHDREGIYSTMPTYSVTLTSRRYGYSMNYDWLQGTSMAAPQVSGLAGLLFATGVSNNSQVRQIIERTADDLGSNGWDSNYGWGRINVYNAVVDAGGGVGNLPPVASFSYSCTDLACTFDGSGSNDPDGSINSYAWDFGDGGTATGATTSHTFGGDGTYAVTLTVTDNEGATGDDTQDVTVSSGGVNQPPVANFSYSCNDLACTFDGSGSYDPDGTIASYQWDFGGDGIASGATASHTFSVGGTYEVTLIVTDNEGAYDLDSQNVTVSSGGGGGTMHVSDIYMWYAQAGRNYTVYTTVAIVDEGGVPVSGATVDLLMNLPGGGTATGSAETLADGTVTFSLKSKETGTYTSEVTDVTHATLTYDDTANVQTSETLGVP